ncbi:hypothetical protein PG984_003546 [Apiospora sp. TS-2023a]
MSDDSQPLTAKQKSDTIMPTSDSKVSATDLTMSKEPQFSAANSAGTAAHRTNVAPLLNMHWFSELASYDKTWWTDASIVQINQQTRAETWDYLIKRNLWVRVTLNKVDNPFGPRTFADKLNRYREFNKSPTPCFDGFCSWPARHHTQISFMFAYEPRRYSIFIREFLDHASEYKSMTIKPCPVTVPGSNRFAKLIEPMTTIRGLDKVSFVGIADSPMLQELGQAMKLPFDSDLDVMKNERYVLDQGLAAELQGRYAAAMRHYEFGLTHEPSFFQSWQSTKLTDLEIQLVEGAPVCNSLSHIKTEMCIGFSRSTHKFIAEIRKLAPDSPLYTIHGIGMWIGKSIQWVREAFNFVGMTDLQRREAHLYSALAFQAEAEFMANIPWGRADISYYPFQARWISWTMEIDPSYDILEQLDEDDKAICRKIQSPPSEGFEVLERKIPLMDDWRGDPDIWSQWCGNGCPRMKKLLEQRHIADSGTEPESQDDLAARYSAVGVTWFSMRPSWLGLVGKLSMSTNNPEYQD